MFKSFFFKQNKKKVYRQTFIATMSIYNAGGAEVINGSGESAKRRRAITELRHVQTVSVFYAAMRQKGTERRQF